MKNIPKVAIRIKALINESGYKQSAIAEKAGYNYQKFSRMLNGRTIITAEDVLPIAAALGVTPNEIFGVNEKIS